MPAVETTAQNLSRAGAFLAFWLPPLLVAMFLGYALAPQQAVEADCTKQQSQGVEQQPERGGAAGVSAHLPQHPHAGLDSSLVRVVSPLAQAHEEHPQRDQRNGRVGHLQLHRDRQHEDHGPQRHQDHVPLIELQVLQYVHGAPLFANLARTA
ncbi:MAG TPA: hypothetical protein DCZ11_06655 [Gammaproteobacteria bacterium]|nr:hypothetical protein [Gammaproteobacteria bacterium]MCH78106.1 hypothetical protein [Gammaproteobacteria bacterium]